MLFANAGRRFEVIRAVIGTAGQTLVYLLIDLTAPLALPAGLAVTLARDTGAVATAVRIGTVGCKLKESGSSA